MNNKGLIIFTERLDEPTMACGPSLKDFCYTDTVPNFVANPLYPQVLGNVNYWAFLSAGININRMYFENKDFGQISIPPTCLFRGEGRPTQQSSSPIVDSVFMFNHFTTNYLCGSLSFSTQNDLVNCLDYHLSPCYSNSWFSPTMIALDFVEQGDILIDYQSGFFDLHLSGANPRC